jgi:coenzyme F420-reducing hydrogenase gamma subunit
VNRVKTRADSFIAQGTCAARGRIDLKIKLQATNPSDNVRQSTDGFAQKVPFNPNIVGVIGRAASTYPHNLDFLGKVSTEALPQKSHLTAT